MPYSGDPSSRFEDAVRYLLGDTDAANELVSDGEIAYLQTTWGATLSAIAIAAKAARMLAHKYSHRPNQTIGRVTVSWADLAAKMLALADDLEMRVGLDATPFAGGIFQADVDAENTDTDRPTPAFDLGMHDSEDGSAEDVYEP